MTPEQHAREAERLLVAAREYPTRGPSHGSMLARAQVHATLSLRAPARKKPGPKPKPKEEGKT